MTEHEVVSLSKLIPGYDPWENAEDFEFNWKRAEKCLDFIAELLHFTEGEKRGHPLVLEDWQKAIVVNVYGWYRRDGTRRYREAFIYVPRKNGKTVILAAIMLLEMFFVNEPGAQLYSAAAEREQAALLFRHASEMIGMESELSVRCVVKPSLKVIERTDGEWSVFKALSADAKTKHGLSPSFVAVDELHAHPDGELVRTLTTGTGSRKQPLVIYITTADYQRVSICNEKYEHAARVRDGDSKDHGFLPVIYEAGPDDDWTDPEVWKKANPNLGVSKSMDGMRRECMLAQEIPAEENSFRRLHLNQRTQQDVRAIPMDQWNGCADGVDDPVKWRQEAIVRLRGRQCVGGLDLGSVSDLTALALLFERDDDSRVFDVLPYFWCPEVNAERRSRRDGVDYIQWANAGFITLTEGNETDYQKVRTDIGILADQFGIQEIAADRLFQGAQLCQDLIRDGLNVSVMGQGYISMAAPTRWFLEQVAGGRLRHGRNPVLWWMAANAATESDNAGGDTVLKFSKKKSTEKIDGIVAICMARAAMMATEDDEVAPFSVEVFQA